MTALWQKCALGLLTISKNESSNNVEILLAQLNVIQWL